MRNLTQEAIQLAEARILQIYPTLADKQVRQQLPDETKQAIVSQLIVNATMIEAQLIQDLQYNDKPSIL